MVTIVRILGLSTGHLEIATIGAAAVVVVGGIGLAVASQLSEVPETAMRIGVGLLLVTVGTFWGGAGAGIRWPGSDLCLLAGYGAVAWLLVRALDGSRPRVSAAKPRLGWGALWQPSAGSGGSS